MTVVQLQKLKRWLILLIACGAIMALVAVAFVLSDSYADQQIKKQLTESTFRYSYQAGERVQTRVLTLKEDGTALLTVTSFSKTHLTYTYELKENADGYYLDMVLVSGVDEEGDELKVNAGEKTYCRVQVEEHKVISIIDDHYTYTLGD